MPDPLREIQEGAVEALVRDARSHLRIHDPVAHQRVVEVLLADIAVSLRVLVERNQAEQHWRARHG